MFIYLLISLYDLFRCELTSWNECCPVPRNELLQNIRGKDALFCLLTDKIDSELLDEAGPNLRVIGTMSVGYDHIDVAECKKRNIRIGYTPDVLTDSTAELTLSLLLAVSRRLLEANEEVRSGGWKSWSPDWLCGQGLRNSVVGIIGFGRIGQEVAKRIIPFKPKKIIFTNRSKKSSEAQEIGAEQVDLDELLSSSDFLIITCALTEETTNIINKNTISKMKTNAIIVNTSRGGLVNQHDLYEALKNNRIRGAGLDVTMPEPLPTNSPLLNLKTCVVLPHIGSADVETRTEMCRITAKNIIAALKGEQMIAEL